MQWQSDIKILGVCTFSTFGTTWLYFSNAFGIVGWREVIADPTAENNIVAAALAAQYAARKVRLYLDNEGKIYGIQTI